MLMGNIMRTFISLRLPPLRVPRGIFDGSKSGGMYLFRTLRSPMVTALFTRQPRDVRSSLGEGKCVRVGRSLNSNIIDK